MNKITRILLILVLAAAAIYFLIVNKPWTNFKSERKDFAIEDTASITRMFFADKKNNYVLLEKDAAGIWWVNGNIKADVSKVNLMLATLKQVEVRNPLNESEYNGIVATLATVGIKAEIYAGEKKIKTFYVGLNTPDNGGTYMMIENSSVPFVTHIPGFVGYLTPRFNVYPVRWKSKDIFTYNPADIKQIVVKYPLRPNKSFLIKQENDEVTVYAYNTNNNQPENVLASNTNFAKYYVAAFGGLYCEGYLDQYEKSFVDSVSNLTPYTTIEVTNTKDETAVLKVFFKQTDKRTKDRLDLETGETLPIDPEKFFALINDSKDLMLIQQYTFGKVFRHAEDFISTQ